jgi:hypothetical protein
MYAFQGLVFIKDPQHFGLRGSNFFIGMFKVNFLIFSNFFTLQFNETQLNIFIWIVVGQFEYRWGAISLSLWDNLNIAAGQFEYWWGAI